MFVYILTWFATDVLTQTLLDRCEQNIRTVKEILIEKLDLLYSCLKKKYIHKFNIFLIYWNLLQIQTYEVAYWIDWTNLSYLDRYR